MTRRLKHAIFPLALFVLNAWVCRELFSLEYSYFLHSIEGAYVSISRYAMENWRDLSWWPLWYAGIPYQNSYPPLLHLTVAAVAALLKISPALSHHAVTGFLYCLGPVAVYALAARLSGSRIYSFFAALFYSLLSPSAFFIAHIRQDMGSVWHQRRLHTLMFYGDGPHVSALALLPLAVLCLDVAVEKRKPHFYLLAALGLAAVVLTNWLGAFALAMAVFSYLLAKTPRAAAGVPAPQVWAITIGIGILAYLLALPWIPPSTIQTIQFNAQTIGADYTGVYKALPKTLTIVGALLLGLKLLLYRFDVSWSLQFFVFFSFFTGGLTLAAEWAEISIVPQPHRYHLEMDLAFSLAGVFALRAPLDRLPRWAKVALVCALLLAAGAQLPRYRRFAGYLIQPIYMRARSEYKKAAWFDQNMNGARVMAPGASSYWLNAFTDTPQIGGGFDQGATNWQIRVAIYVIYRGQNAGDKEAEISLLWLKAFGLRAIGVTGPGSEEAYKPFAHPKKFEGLLEPAWRDGHDVIYRVPQRSDSLAHVVRADELVQKPPIHGLDVEQVRTYVAALEDPARSPASFRWRNRHSAEIIANLRPEEILSVQVSYHPGWQATVEGSPRRVFSDAIGLMAIEPRCDGPCKVELTYDGGLEMRLARWASLLSFLGCVIWIALSRRRRSA